MAAVESLGAIYGSDAELAEAPGAGSYGVLDAIARRVLLSGGEALVERQGDPPDGAAVAAILRYAP